MMRRIVRGAIAATALSVLSWTHSTSAAGTPAPLFASDDVLHLTIKGPITAMARATADTPVPGLLTVKGAASESLPVTLSVRGTTRRKKDICSFPPLRVEFNAKPAVTSIFKGQRSLKLVTHCQANEGFQQYVLLEYAAYRLYNALTSESFRVRLAQIGYVDDDRRILTSRPGFFIEDVDDVAKRNGHERLRRVNRISNSQLDPAAAARFAVFQYMIGNLDWAMIASVPGEDCCHNARLVGVKGATTGLIPVPYDFDFSGMVNAPYAVPPDIVKTRDVRTRRYRGFCSHNGQAQALAADLLTRRTALLAILDATPQLSEGSRRRAGSYLADFFDQIGSAPQLTRIMKTCLH